MAKKIRTADTAHGIITAHLDAAKGRPVPPKHIELRDCDIPYWNVIMDNRARGDWTDVTLTVAAQLARTQADIDDWQKKLDQDGPTVVDRFGQDKANPIVGIIEAATRRQLSLMRNLGFAIDIQEQGAKDKMAKEVHKTRKQVEEEDDLLAT